MIGVISAEVEGANAARINCASGGWFDFPQGRAHYENCIIGINMLKQACAFDYYAGSADARERFANSRPNLV